jgi:hypothetical protein
MEQKGRAMEVKDISLKEREIGEGRGERTTAGDDGGKS